LQDFYAYENLSLGWRANFVACRIGFIGSGSCRQIGGGVAG
jgi:hypothetical protein